MIGKATVTLLFLQLFSTSHSETLLFRMQLRNGNYIDVFLEDLELLEKANQVDI